MLTLIGLLMYTSLVLRLLMRILEVRSLYDLDKNDLNTIRRSSENEDGMFNDCQCSDHEVEFCDNSSPTRCQRVLTVINRVVDLGIEKARNIQSSELLSSLGCI